MITKSGFILQDLVATEAARIYSNEQHKPFKVMVGDFGDYDIASIDYQTRIELKVETTPIRTSSVAIEYFCTDPSPYGGVSGILSTKANVWLHVVLESSGFVAHEYDVDMLRKLVIEEGVTKRSGRNALCRIIPLAIFKKHAQRIFAFDTLFAEEIKELTHAVQESAPPTMLQAPASVEATELTHGESAKRAEA